MIPASTNQLLSYTGYRISRSLRFRSSASAYLNRTPASAGTRTTWTWSGWVKLGSLTTTNILLGAQANGNSGTSRFSVYFNSSGQLNVEEVTIGTAAQIVVVTNQVFRDPSAWYHIMVVLNTTSATTTITGSSTDRVRIYINGSQVTAFSGTPTVPSQNFNTAFNNNISNYFSYSNNLGTIQYNDGYLAEVNFIDGQALTPSSFGAFDTNGVWQPARYTGSYGTNGFYLNFSDNSGATATTIGKDSSGNSNNWTPTNIVVTSGTTCDSMIDSPTNYADGGTGRGNYATLNPLTATACTPAQGNLYVSTTNGWAICFASHPLPATGMYYWEFTNTSALALANQRCAVGFALSSTTSPRGSGSNYFGGVSGDVSYLGFNGSAPGGVYSTWSTNDVVGIAVDCSTSKYWFAVNNVWQNSGNPAAGTGNIGTLSGAASLFCPTIGNVSNAAGYDMTGHFNFGQRPFAYTPPSGFSALNTQNLPTPTIAAGNKYFDATTYTGNGSSLSVTNSGSFQPDLVWVKSRSTSSSNWLVNSVTGVNNGLISDNTAAEQVLTITSAFNSNGFTVNYASNTTTNNNLSTYVGWQWKAGGTGVSNTSGSITSTVSANTSAGFSVVTYTGTGANATVGHGLGVAPSMIIVKNRQNASNWPVIFTGLGSNYLYLNGTNALIANSNMFTSYPSSSVFYPSTNSEINQSGINLVAYCFANVAGYSSTFSFTGNGAADGPMVNLSFRPKWILIKRTDAASDWVIMDTTRDTYNASGLQLYPDIPGAEVDYRATYPIDILSNGFKLRNATFPNVSGGTYIGFAIAENPFKTSRAR